jgi:hypothetical protein
LTENEVRHVLALVSVAWPDRQLFSDDDELDEVSSLWLGMLSDIADGDLIVAAHALISTKERRPSIAEFRAEAMRAKVSGLTAGEAWAEVVRATGSVGARRIPRWSSSAVALAVQSIGGWTPICRSQNMTADRARFLDNYDKIVSGARHEVLAGRASSVELLLAERVESSKRNISRLGGGASLASLLEGKEDGSDDD